MTVGDVFEVGNFEAARKIILTGDTESRWRIETPYLTSLLVEWLDPRPGDLVLDFGCGIGRLARPLLERTGCSVAGYDTSRAMRALAHGYVRHGSFFAVTELPIPVRAAFAVWALQHAVALEADLWAIAQSLPTGGKFLLVNEKKRFVPKDGGWEDDGKNVLLLAQKFFRVLRVDALSHSFVPHGESAYWALLERL